MRASLNSANLNQDLLNEIDAGETLAVEFKSDQRDWSDSKLCNAVVSMANASGGRIYIGVDDNGRISGSKNVGSHWANENVVHGVIIANTSPSISTQVNFFEHQNKKIVCVTVPSSDTTVGTKKGHYLKRRYNSQGKPENLPMTTDEIVRGTTRYGTQDFSVTVLNHNTVDINCLDMALAQETFTGVLKTTTNHAEQELFSQHPNDVLKSLGLLSNEMKPNIAGLLLFGKEEVIRDKLPNHYVQYQVFGENGQLLKNERFCEPIAKLLKKLLMLPELQRNSDEFRLKGQTYVVPEYPEDSRREVIANAVVHRDYTMYAGVQIQLYDSELMIGNPGGFPIGVTERNILSAPPTPRNRRLAEAMSKLKFVESSGRGVDFIFKGQAIYGRPAPDYSESDNSQVSVRLVGGKANLDFCKFIFSTVENPSIHEVLILNSLFLNRDQTLDELKDLVQKPPVFTQQLLYRMHQKGLIEISNEKNARYFLKGSIHHIARKVVKPERMTNKEMENAANQILKELERRSLLSKEELADILGLSPPQTYRLLQKLKKDGALAIEKKLWKLNKL